MLYRCVRRPSPTRSWIREFRARVFQTDRGDALPRRSHRARRSHRPRGDLVASRVPLGDPRLARRAESLAPRPTTRSTLFHIETDNPYRTIDRRTLNYGQPALTDAANKANQQ